MLLIIILNVHINKLPCGPPFQVPEEVSKRDQSKCIFFLITMANVRKIASHKQPLGGPWVTFPRT